jgi:hypothetical protein
MAFGCSAATSVNAPAIEQPHIAGNGPRGGGAALDMRQADRNETALIDFWFRSGAIIARLARGDCSDGRWDPSGLDEEIGGKGPLAHAIAAA